jgi:hypothetical protein
MMTPSAPRITEISVRTAIASASTSDSVSGVPPFPSPRASRPAWVLETAQAAHQPQAAPPPTPTAFPTARADIIQILTAPASLPVHPSTRAATPAFVAAPAPAVMDRIDRADRAVRSTVAPVATTLPPPPLPFTLPPMRAGFSADSKLLAGGGAIAFAMLALAVGVWVGRSGQSGASSTPSAAAFPVLVETKADTKIEAKAAAMAPVPVPVATFAPVAPPVAPSMDLDTPATIDVQQLPLASRARAHSWVPVAATKGPVGSGWSVAATPLHRAAQQPASAQPSTPAPAAVDPAAQPQAIQVAQIPAAVASADPPTAPMATEATATAAPPVDPFVQAVREDIREDESSRGAGK